MNLTFLLIWGIVVVGLIVLGCTIDDDLFGPVVVVGVIGALISFLTPIGVTTHEETTSFRVERTPYRLIVTAYEQERSYTDAYILSLGNPKVVKRTVFHNAWGMELGGPIEPIFPTP